MIYNSEIMPEELISERRMTRGIYIFDFFTIIAFAAFGYLTRMLVASSFQTIYVFGNAAIGFYLTRYSKSNPKKRIYQSIRYFLSRSREQYNPIAITNEIIEENTFNGKIH